MSTTSTQGPIFPTAAEQEQLSGVIRRYHGSLPNARLIGPDNETIELPAVVYDVLTQVVQAMSRGLAVAVMPLHLELTTQQAAEILNVSRQYLVQLLDDGAIPYTRVGTHRRIRFGDVRAYKETRDRQRRAGLDRLARLSDALGMYERDFPTEERDG
jgi:excisionase family DNA binding protein